MRRAALCALALATALVQVVLIDGLPLPGGTVPDISLVLVVAAGLTQGPVTGLLTGFVAGMSLDLAPPGGYLIGASALSFCLIGYGCGRLGARLERSAPGLLAVAALAVGAGEAGQAAAGLIAPGSRITLAEVWRGLPLAVLYDVLLCAALLSAAAMVRARPWARLPGSRPARSPALTLRPGGTEPVRGGAAPRTYSAYAAIGTGLKPAAAVAVQMPVREVPLHLGAQAREDRRAGSLAGRARGGGSNPRRLRPGRGGPGSRRRGPGRGGTGPAGSLPRREPGRPVQVRFGGTGRSGAPPHGTRFPGTSVGVFMRWLFRRQPRMCRRVPRWKQACSSPRGVTYRRAWRAGGLR